jgi:hypothetical protein
MHARHYSPLTGRFLQPDPSAAETNLYGYAGNNPATTVDPSGTIQCVLGLAGGPGGLVAACAVEIILVVGFLVVAEVNLQVQQQHWCPRGCAIRLFVPGSGTVTSIPYYRYLPRRVVFPVRLSLRGWFLAKSAQEQARRGQAPRGIERVDSPKSSVPGSQWEVHVNGGSINKDGTIKHVPRSPLTKQQKEWMRKHGWNV